MVKPIARMRPRVAGFRGILQKALLCLGLLGESVALGTVLRDAVSVSA